MTRPVPVGRHVEQARTPDGRVDYKTLERVPASTEIALENIVHRYGRLAEIADEVMDAFSRAARHVVVITTGDRLQRVVIDEFVASEDGPIGGLRRVVVQLVLGTGLRVGRCVGTGSEGEGRRQRNAACQRSASLPARGTIRRAATARHYEDYCHGSCSCLCRSKARRGSCRLDFGFAGGTTYCVGVETNRGGADGRCGRRRHVRGPGKTPDRSSSCPATAIMP